MADNIPVTPGSGKTVATDEVTDGTLGTVQVQFIKLMDGTLDSTNKLSVSAGGAAKVDGSAVTQPISVSSLPLPTGAATQTTLAEIATDTDNLDVALSTRNLETTQLAVKTDLDEIATDTDKLDVNLSTRLADSTFTGRINTQGQKTMAASTPVVLASDQSTIPISGTVTANAGTNLNTSALALDATLTNATQKTKLVDTAGTNAAVIDAAGDLQVDVNNFPATQTVAGTVTSNQGTANTAANKWPIEIVDSGGVNIAAVNANNELKVEDIDLELAQGSTTSGQVGPLIQGAVTTAAPTYTTAQTNPLSLTTTGALRTDSSATTQPISGTVTANAGTGTFNIQANASVNVAQINGSTTVTAATGVQKVGIVGNTGAVVDAAGQNAASPPNEILISGQFNTTPTTITTGNVSPLQLQANGKLLVANAPLDGDKATYSAAVVGIASAATATDIFTIFGSGTKTIRVTHLRISGTQTTAGEINVLLIKRSTANTAGTSAAATAVPHDSTSAAATATVLSYTANPTLGTTVGNVRSEKLFAPATAATSAGSNVIYEYGTRPGQAIVLRGTAQGLCFNLNGVTVTGGNFDFSVEWTEE